jgi:hypothetical protein
VGHKCVAAEDHHEQLEQVLALRLNVGWRSAANIHQFERATGQVEHLAEVNLKKVLRDREGPLVVAATAGHWSGCPSAACLR